MSQVISLRHLHLRFHPRFHLRLRLHQAIAPQELLGPEDLPDPVVVPVVAEAAGEEMELEMAPAAAEDFQETGGPAELEYDVAPVLLQLGAWEP